MPIQPQNKAMRTIFMLALMSFFCAVGQAQLRGSTEQEFQIKKEFLEKRYQNFFVREIEADRRERLRQEAASQQKAARKVIQEAYEKSRREYVANRKAEPEISNEQHLKEIAEQKKAHEKTRLEYIRRRDNLKRIESSTGVIPEWIEYKLYEPYEVSDSSD